MASESTRLTNPPRWAEALLRASLRPSDRESISGDLLEEYRAARRPALGALVADLWYFKHVASVVWRLVWPPALTLAVLTLAALTFQGIRVGYGSILPAPGLSLMHALIYVWAGYHGARRTGLIRTAMLAAGITSVVGFTAFFGFAAATIPGLIVGSFDQPFEFVILSIYLMLSLGYSLLLGASGGAAGKWIAPAPVDIRFSLRQQR